MDASSKPFVVRGNTVPVLSALIMLTILLLPASLTSSGVYAQEERVFQNTIPKDVPLKVKIKNEKSFKDLSNEKWVRELELEVTNTGDKPIYFLHMFLRTNVGAGIEVLLEDTVRDGRLGLTIQYGRVGLGDLISKPEPDDVPIKPGETYTFKIHPGEVGGWEMSIRNHRHPQPTRIQLVFQSISFGDGSGLFGSGGQPYPPPRKQS